MKGLKKKVRIPNKLKHKARESARKSPFILGLMREYFILCRGIQKTCVLKAKWAEVVKAMDFYKKSHKPRMNNRNKAGRRKRK